MKLLQTIQKNGRNLFVITDEHAYTDLKIYEGDYCELIDLHRGDLKLLHSVNCPSRKRAEALCREFVKTGKLW